MALFTDRLALIIPSVSFRFLRAPQAGAPPFARRVFVRSVRLVYDAGIEANFARGGGREIRYNSSQCKRAALRFPNVYGREQERSRRGSCVAQLHAGQPTAPPSRMRFPGKLTFFSPCVSEADFRVLRVCVLSRMCVRHRCTLCGWLQRNEKRREPRTTEEELDLIIISFARCKLTIARADRGNYVAFHALLHATRISMRASSAHTRFGIVEQRLKKPKISY